MAGSYCFDLTIERADVLSLIHHCFGPAMLVWIRYQFSSFTTADAPMCRLLISFVFFGAACGGTMTTSILVIMKLMKAHLSPQQIYAYVSKLVWALTINTLIATTFGSLYMLYWLDPLFEYWSYWGIIPLLLSGFEYYLQWRWAFRFQNIQDDLHAKALNAGSKSEKGSVSTNLLESVKTKYMVLRFVLGVWLVSYVSIYARIGHEAVLDTFSLRAF
jgi:hypothetical protein